MTLSKSLERSWIRMLLIPMLLISILLIPPLARPARAAELFVPPVEDTGPGKISCVFDTLHCAAFAHHTGIDYDDSAGLDIRATASGKVVLVMPLEGNDHGMGNTVVLEHLLENGETVYSLYAHLHEVDPALGLEHPANLVIRGQRIGRVGGSGYTSLLYWGRHLHFEIKNGPFLGDPETPDGHWGYTPTTATGYGYSNPADYFDNPAYRALSQARLSGAAMSFTADGPLPRAILEIEGDNIRTGSHVPSVSIALGSGPSEPLESILSFSDHSARVLLPWSLALALRAGATVEIEVDNGETRDRMKFPFRDLEPGSWYETTVNALAVDGLLKGRSAGVFEPAALVNRAEFLTMAIRALEVSRGPLPTPSIPLPAEVSGHPEIQDVWYFEILEKAFGFENPSYLQGGQPDTLAFWEVDGIFSPGTQGNTEARIREWQAFWARPIERSEAARALFDSLGLGAATAFDKVANPVIDVPFDAHEADWIYACLAEGLLRGRRPGEFVPRGRLNRAEAAKLMRLIVEGGVR